MIINKLPQLFSSQTAWVMEDHIAAEIAGESEAKKRLRDQYNAKLAVFKASEGTCKRYCNRLVTGKLINHPISDNADAIT